MSTNAYVLPVIDLLAMFPDMKEMDDAMRNGMSWYDMLCREEEEVKFKNRLIVERDGWTDVRSKRTKRVK